MKDGWMRTLYQTQNKSGQDPVISQIRLNNKSAHLEKCGWNGDYRHLSGPIESKLELS